MSLENFLIHTVSFTRPTSVVDSQGGETFTEAELYPPMRACVQPAKPFQIYVYSLQNLRVEQVMYTDQNIDNLRAGDFMYFNSERYVLTGVRNLINNGRVYEVFIYRYDK